MFPGRPFRLIRNRKGGSGYLPYKYLLTVLLVIAWMLQHIPSQENFNEIKIYNSSWSPFFAMLVFIRMMRVCMMHLIIYI